LSPVDADFCIEQVYYFRSASVFDPASTSSIYDTRTEVKTLPSAGEFSTSRMASVSGWMVCIYSDQARYKVLPNDRNAEFDFHP
jgi:hypothetical protein